MSKARVCTTGRNPITRSDSGFRSRMYPLKDVYVVSFPFSEPPSVAVNVTVAFSELIASYCLLIASTSCSGSADITFAGICACGTLRVCHRHPFSAGSASISAREILVRVRCITLKTGSREYIPLPRRLLRPHLHRGITLIGADPLDAPRAGTLPHLSRAVPASLRTATAPLDPRQPPQNTSNSSARDASPPPATSDPDCRSVPVAAPRADKCCSPS